MAAVSIVPVVLLADMGGVDDVVGEVRVGVVVGVVPVVGVVSIVGVAAVIDLILSCCNWPCSWCNWLSWCR